MKNVWLPKNRDGLTLVELMIVMALMIILASISLGAMKTLLRGQKVAQAAISVRQYLQNAQMRAVGSGRPVAVFFDRVNMNGESGSPTPSNYSSTRIQFGEVFPPYTGDVENTVGKLTGSNYATAVVFEPLGANAVANVAAGFGSVNGANLFGGFINVGDVIEFDDCEARFTINSMVPNLPSVGSITVNFENPRISRQLPLKSGATIFKRFRIYRQPTRSFVGSIVLPRNTCVDFSLSGLGLADSGIGGGTFHLSNPPDFGATVNPGDFSRIGIVFYSDGKIAYILDENTKANTNIRAKRVFIEATSMIYLLVGRSDQVLPGFPTSNLKTAALQHPEYGASELPKSNLVDPENIWITCNPATGEIKSSPVADLDLATVQTRWTSAQSNANEVVSDLIIEARSLAAAGMSN
jgi:Tfp pilus assembly protein FimT